MSDPALALIEFDSIAAGIFAGDAMVKKAPVARIVGGTVHGGKYLVMISGEVGPIQESLTAGLALDAGSVVDYVYLPGVHPDVPACIGSARHSELNEALGIVETTSVASAIHAADAALKGADVDLVELRLADGLGGKGLALFCGSITDVEAALDAATGVLADNGHLLNAVSIPRLHPDMAENLSQSTRFRVRATTL